MRCPGSPVRAGVAIGQMGEYMADARASGEKFGSIIKNFAGMALPIAGIATAVQLVGKYMKGIADTKAFEKKRVEDFADGARRCRAQRRGAAGRSVRGRGQQDLAADRDRDP